ncbi:hypothetical protein IK112_00180 [Candidatus Saccharibacteria bacterium]|nr:hypothetical protein [Candidatus Saccharibacteria bacterium]
MSGEKITQNIETEEKPTIQPEITENANRMELGKRAFRTAVVALIAGVIATTAFSGSNKNNNIKSNNVAIETESDDQIDLDNEIDNTEGTTTTMNSDKILPDPLPPQSTPPKEDLRNTISGNPYDGFITDAQGHMVAADKIIPHENTVATSSNNSSNSKISSSEDALSHFPAPTPPRAGNIPHEPENISDNDDASNNGHTEESRQNVRDNQPDHNFQEEANF